jgi:SAM-dependent methyltransferase
MIKDTFDVLVGSAPPVRRFMIRGLYQVLTRLDRDAEMTFMNYGYADLAPDVPPVPLSEADERNRYCVQLYRRVVDGVELRGKRVLEVGSGRGGGAAYVARHYLPAAMLGVDVSEGAVAFCRAHHAAPGLSFVHGDAEHLPAGDDEYDVVLNVESSHGYGSLDGFLAEVRRVLRPGGYFLYTDHRGPHQLEEWHARLAASGLRLLDEQEITPNVLRALDLDDPRKQSLIERRCPWILKNAIREFAAVRGSQAYRRFERGESRYLAFKFQKPLEG